MQNDANVFVYNGGEQIPEDIDTKSSITHIHVEGVTSIPNYAFRKLPSLESVFISDGVTSIGDKAFTYCTKLISIRLPGSLETIGRGAFFYCNKLVRIGLPPNVIRIVGDISFLFCSSLTNIHIPTSMTSIAKGTFSQCTALSQVTIPTSISKLEEYSFSHCHSIISIKLHDGIQQIDRNAFGCCALLLSIQVPPSTTTIGDYAFASCTSLMIAYFPSAAIEDSNRVFGLLHNSPPHCPNIILLTDRDDFIYYDDSQGYTPSFTLHAIQQCIRSLPNNNTTTAIANDNNNTVDNTTTATMTTTRTRTRLQQQLQALHQVLHDHNPDIAQRAQRSGLNLLHLLVYFPGDILQPLTMLLDKCPLVTTAVDSTGRTPFHHTITSTQQNMDSACYDLLASCTPDKVAVHLAINSLRSGAPWHEVYDIVEAKPNGLGVADEESGLMPFMMAAADADEEETGGSNVTLGLTAVYELLCMKPDVMNEYVDVGSSGGTGNMKTCVGYDGSEIMMKRRRFE